MEEQNAQRLCKMEKKPLTSKVICLMNFFHKKIKPGVVLCFPVMAEGPRHVCVCTDLTKDCALYLDKLEERGMALP